ncbi:MAG: IS630 family transposase, partial [bacterium]
MARRGRPPRVFVRKLTKPQKRKMKKIVEKGGGASPVKWRRSLVVLMSSQGNGAAEIAAALGADDDWVRDVIHAFNRDRMDSLRPRWAGGRPPTITQEMRAEIVKIAATRPQLVKEPFTRWSLTKLRDYLIKNKVVPAISKERLRQILLEEDIFIHRTKSWKRSPDPDFDKKAAKVLRLYRRPPTDGVVICFDEHGPIAPIPHAGWGWATAGRPPRIPANYRKGKGVRFFFGAYDVANDQLSGLWRAHKTGADMLSFFRWVRRRYKDRGRIYLIMDNLKAHFTQDIRNWAKDNDVELVPIPTYASWLNLIEVESRHITEFVISNSNYQSHEDIEPACSAYLRRRNLDARRNFEQR